MGTNIFREYPATHWCFSWWHKVRYGSKETRQDIKGLAIVEYWCKKCGGKTDGYTYFKIGEFTISSSF